MRGTRVVWSAIVLMSALSPAGAAQSAGGDSARFAQSPQYPLLPRALEIELALSAAPKHLRDDATVWALDKSGYAIAKKGSKRAASAATPCSEKLARSSNSVLRGILLLNESLSISTRSCSIWRISPSTPLWPSRRTVKRFDGRGSTSFG